MTRLLMSAMNRWKNWMNRWAKFRRSLYADQHQLTSTTEFDRYPALFASVQSLLSGIQPRVLSYGCSTGEECVTLLKYLNPEVLVGADINESNLKVARQKNAAQRIHYTLSTPEGLASHAPYDVIFCLSVLCRWEDTKDRESIEAIYPFLKFESAVAELSHLLSPNGLLVIFNSNYRFEDSDTFVAQQFTPVPTPNVPDSGFVHKFDRQHRRVREVHRTCVYRKAS